jgi:predicted PurR-regulated permease PerM
VAVYLSSLREIMKAGTMDITPIASDEASGFPEAPAVPDIKTVFLGGIFFLLFMAALNAASAIAIPVAAAIVLKLVLQPAQRFLERLRLPPLLAALVLVALLIAGVAELGSLSSEPAAAWSAKLQESFPQFQQRLGFIRKPIQSAQKLVVSAEKMTHADGPKAMAVAVQGDSLTDRVFRGTRLFAGMLMTTMLVLLFLLASGDTFLRRVVEILPKFGDKRQAVDIFKQIEHDLSAYLLTITAMNACVGAITALLVHLLRLEDPVLWGVMAFFLNYVPVIGPAAGVAVLLLVGLTATPDIARAVLPALIYLGVHLTESMIVTPLLVARRQTLNPALVILSLLFWYWMWGVAGAILAMPMLAIVKIVCDRVERLKPIGHFLEA